MVGLFLAVESKGFVGAGNGGRTRDIHLGKKVLSSGTLRDAWG